MSALETLQEELNSAQSELAEAEIALIEATSRAEAANIAAARLAAAVAALKGESPPAPQVRDGAEAARLAHNQEDGGASPSPATNKPENPLAHIKCAGCGTTGEMSEAILPAPSGAPVRMLVCGNCGNQVL